MVKATYGSAWNMWPFMSNNTTATTLIGAQDPDNIIIVGLKAGKGIFWRATVTGNPLLYGATTTNVYTVNNDTNGVVTVSSPTGGMGQFKGLTYGTEQ